VGTRMVWQSCSINDRGSSVTVAVAPVAAEGVVSCETCAMCGRMKGIVKIPSMLVATVRSRARDTFPPNCCRAGEQQGRAGQGRAGQGRAGQGVSVWCIKLL
jgi:hypothetical protein